MHNCHNISRKGETCHGASRLFLIIILECTFVIWKLRCKRNLDPSQQGKIAANKASNRVMETINSCLSQDRILTSKKRYSKKALPEKLVLSTWSRTLQDEHHLPRNWLTASRVLVVELSNVALQK